MTSGKCRLPDMIDAANDDDPSKATPLQAAHMYLQGASVEYVAAFFRETPEAIRRKILFYFDQWLAKYTEMMNVGARNGK